MNRNRLIGLSRMAALGLLLAPLATLLAQDAADAYREARRALNRQQFDTAATAFRALRGEHPDSRYVAESYYWEAFAHERNGDLERAVEVVDELLREHPGAPTLDDARALRIRACSELARRGDGECAEVISSTVREPAELDDATRMAAVNALLNMRPDRAVPIAARVAANRDQPVTVRRQALFVLADKARGAEAESRARQVLRDVALDETEDRELRDQAVFWLSEIRGEETLGVLSEVVESAADAELKSRAVFAISQVDEPGAMSLLRRYAENDALDTRLRKQAIFWIGEEGAQQALPFLRQLYPSLVNEELKRQALFAVSETNAAGSADWLLERARDASEPREMRKQALFWAAESGLSIGQLDSLYEDFDDVALREHLIWLIAEQGGEGSLESLLDIARNDPNPDMRAKAVFWIGDSEDPRAAEYLLELLEE